MKSATAALLEKSHLAGLLQFSESDGELVLTHSLTATDKSHLVRLEYGSTIVGDVDVLFDKLIHEMVKSAITKINDMYKDKLSEL